MRRSTPSSNPSECEEETVVCAEDSNVAGQASELLLQTFFHDLHVLAEQTPFDVTQEINKRPKPQEKEEDLIRRVLYRLEHMYAHMQKQLLLWKEELSTQLDGRLHPENAKADAHQIMSLEGEISPERLDRFKSEVVWYVQRLKGTIEKLMRGSLLGMPEKNGQTLQQEIMESGISFPLPERGEEESHEIGIPNAELSLYGGAQYERCLDEFEWAVRSTSFPRVSVHETASCMSMVTRGFRNSAPPSIEAASSEIVHIKTQKILLPLAEVVLQRCKFVLKRVFDIAVEVINLEMVRHARLPSSKTDGHQQQRREKEKEGFNEHEMFDEHNEHESCSAVTVGFYDGLIEELKLCFYAFVDKLGCKCEEQFQDGFRNLSRFVDWDLMNNIPSGVSSDHLLHPSPEETKQRVLMLMEGTSVSQDGAASGRQTRAETTHENIVKACQMLFRGIGFFFMKYTRCKLNSFLLYPIFHNLGEEFMEYVFRISDERYRQILHEGQQQMFERLNKLGPFFAGPTAKFHTNKLILQKWHLKTMQKRCGVVSADPLLEERRTVRTRQTDVSSQSQPPEDVLHRQQERQAKERDSMRKKEQVQQARALETQRDRVREQAREQEQARLRVLREQELERERKQEQARERALREQERERERQNTRELEKERERMRELELQRERQQARERALKEQERESEQEKAREQEHERERMRELELQREREREHQKREREEARARALKEQELESDREKAKERYKEQMQELEIQREREEQERLRNRELERLRDEQAKEQERTQQRELEIQRLREERAREEERIRLREAEIQREQEERAREEKAIRHRELEIQREQEERAREEEIIRQREAEMQRERAEQAKERESIQRREMEIQREREEQAREQERIRERELQIQQEQEERERIRARELEAKRIQEGRARDQEIIRNQQRIEELEIQHEQAGAQEQQQERQLAREQEQARERQEQERERERKREQERQHEQARQWELEQIVQQQELEQERERERTQSERKREPEIPSEQEHQKEGKGERERKRGRNLFEPEQAQKQERATDVGLRMEQEVTSEQHPGGPEVVEQESERRSIQQQDQKRVETHPKALTQEQELEERKEDADVKQQEQEQIDDKEKPQTSSPMQASDDENLFVLGEWDEQITPSKDASFSLSSQEINSSPLTSSTPSELQSGTPNTGSLLSQLSQISQLSQLADAEAEEELVSEDDEEKQSQQERHVLLPEGMPKQDKFRTTNIATEKVEEREDVNKELRKDVTSDLVNRVDEGEDKAKEDEEEAELSARSPPLSPLLPSQPLSLEESEPGSQLLAPDSQPPILPENFSPLSSPITTSDSGPSLPPPPPNTELESLEEEETRFLDSDKRRKSILTASPSSETSSASVGGRGTEGGSSSKGGNGAKPDKHLRAAFSKWVGGSQLEKILRGAGSHPVDADEQESEEFAETKSPRKAQRENLTPEKETNSRRKPAQTTSDQSKGITSSPPNDKQHSAISEPQLQRHDSSEDFQDAKTPLQKRQRKRTAGTPHSKHKKRERQSRPGGEGSSTSEISEAEDEEEEEEKEGDEDEGGKAANKSRNTPEKRKLSERHEPTEPSSKAARLQTNSTDNSKRDPKMELAVFSPSKAKLSKKSNSYCSLFEPTAEEENKLQRTSEPTKKRRLSLSPPPLRQSTNASKDTPRPSKKQKHPSSSPPDESHEPHKQKKSKEEDGTPVAPNVAVRGYLLSTCLTARQSQIFMAMVRNHPEFKLAKQQWEIQATHLVVGEKKRTVKVLKALALGLWVVSFDWVLESKKAGKWLPEEPFELVTEFPSSMASRLNRTNQAEAPGLFFGKIFYVHRPINTPPETLASLIELSGGVIGQTAAESDYCIRHRDTPNLPPVTEATPRPHTITEATLLDCIVAFRLPHQLA